MSSGIYLCVFIMWIWRSQELDGVGAMFRCDSQEQLLLEGAWRDSVVREESSGGTSFQFQQACKFSFEG